MTAGSRSQCGMHTHLLKPQKHPNVKTILEKKCEGKSPQQLYFCLAYFHQNNEIESSLGAAWTSNKHITLSFARLFFGSGKKKKKDPTCRIVGGGDTVKYNASIFVSVFLVGGGVHLRVKHRALGKCRVIGRAN